MKSLKPFTRLLVGLTALSLIVAYFVPIWQILMWAPQYPEGLSMKIWIDNLTGNVKTISALNHYVGMKPIEVAMFPEFAYLKYLLGAIIAVGFVAFLSNRRFMLVSYLFVIVLAGVVALIDFYNWGYDYGHNLNPDAPIKVPGMAYQPPLIGTKVLLNFTAFSGPDIGAWILIITAIILSALLIYEWRTNP